jgi:Tfp pilus assembly protein PilN
VNAVNLLPAKHRPRTPTGGQQGSSYVVIGVLGAALLMVLMYAVTVNGINEKKGGVARAKAETAQAQKRAQELAPYGNFIQVKQQRVDTVKSKAVGRIDWERLARGLGAVLPEGVWLTKANATTTGSGQPGGGGGASTPPAQSAPPAGGGSAPAPSAGGGEEAQAPQMALSGCAPDHVSIATTLVRLRHLPAVTDVTLVSASRPEDAASGPAAGGAPGATAGAGDSCGTSKKKTNLKWDVNVTFRPQAGSELEQATGEKDKVPTALGGGA